MKRVKLLVAAAVVTCGLLALHSTKAFADTLGSSNLPDIGTSSAVQQKISPSDMPISLARSNISSNFYIWNIPGATRVRYGTSGEGRPLYYYKIGNGDKTVIANFEIHGFEDAWNHDGIELTNIAHQVIKKVVQKNNSSGLNGWSIIIIPAANPDGILDGYTNNGPGRAQISKRIDLNRDFPTFFEPEYNSRNYTGPHPLGAPEAVALADLVQKESRTSKDFVLLDTHGWLDMTIGDPQIGRYFQNTFGLGHNRGYIPAGHGYFISYGHAEGAEVSLVELPMPSSSSQINSSNYTGKFYTGLMNLIHGSTGLEYMNKKGIVVNTGGVNLKMRSGATTVGQVLSSYSPGASVHVVGKIDGWYKVYKEGTGYGYVSGDYLKIVGDYPTVNPTPTPDPTPNPKPDPNVNLNDFIKGVVINTSVPLHVRKGPSTSSAIISQLSPGALVHIVSRDGDWLKIYKEDVGYAYVSAKYVGLLHKPNPNPSVNLDNFEKGVVVNTNKAIMVRNRPSYSADAVSQLSPGALVHIVSKDGEWVKIYKEDTGYAYFPAKYVEPLNSPNPTPHPDPSVNLHDFIKGVVINTNVPIPVRTAPSDHSSAVSQLSPGALVHIVYKQGDWMKIYKEGTGYAYFPAKYVKDLYVPNLVPGINLDKFEKGVVVNTNTPVLVRKGASYNSDAISQLSPGALVHIVAHEGNWIKIYKEDTGYAYFPAKYVKALNKPKPIPEVNLNNFEKGVVVNTNVAIPVRTAPSENSTAVSQLSPGALVHVVAHEGSWIKIFKENVGYAYFPAKYVEPLTQNKPDTTVDLNKFEKGVVVNTNVPIPVRKGASYDSTAISQLSPGALVHVVAHEGDWLKIYKIDTGYAYFPAKYVAPLESK